MERAKMNKFSIVIITILLSLFTVQNSFALSPVASCIPTLEDLLGKLGTIVKLKLLYTPADTALHVKVLVHYHDFNYDTANGHFEQTKFIEELKELGVTSVAIHREKSDVLEDLHLNAPLENEGVFDVVASKSVLEKMITIRDIKLILDESDTAPKANVERQYSVLIAGQEEYEAVREILEIAKNFRVVVNRGPLFDPREQTISFKITSDQEFAEQLNKLEGVHVSSIGLLKKAKTNSEHRN
jgi:hypothetical protein